MSGLRERLGRLRQDSSVRLRIIRRMTHRALPFRHQLSHPRMLGNRRQTKNWSYRTDSAKSGLNG